MTAIAATPDALNQAAAPSAGSTATAAAPATTTGASAGVVSAPGTSPGHGSAGSPPAPSAAASGKSLLDTTEPAKAAAAPVADTLPVEIVLKVPEGVEIPEADLTAVKSFAKEHGLSQKQAEAILTRDVASRKSAAEAQANQVQTLNENWRAESEKHPEIGGDKFQASVANAKRALSAFATPEERAAIANSPFGNNPIFLAIMARAGAKMPTEDTVHPGGTGSSAPAKSPGEIMYPHLYRKG